MLRYNSVMLLTRLLTQSINDNANAEILLSPFADKTIAIEFKPIRFKTVWRIDANGKVAVVAPQIRGDVKIRVVSLPNNIKIEGDAALLKSFSTLFNQMDWAVVISDAFGPVLAPRLLVAIEQLRDKMNAFCDKHFLDPDTFAAYCQQIKDINHKIDNIDQRINSLISNNNYAKEKI